MTAAEYQALQSAWDDRHTFRSTFLIHHQLIEVANREFDKAWEDFNVVQERRDRVLDAFDTLVLGRQLRPLLPVPPKAFTPPELLHYAQGVFPFYG